jgi:limonene 1,2-monooxygenase
MGFVVSEEPGMSRIPLRHGAFLPPFHPMNENPSACLDRDLELM